MKARLEQGTVKIYRQLPTRYNINGVPHNLFKLPVSVAEDEGFFNVVEVIPTIYQAVEDLIESDFDGTNWIQRIRDFTTQEITDYDDSIVANELNKEISDGVNASNKLKVFLKKTLSPDNYKLARIQVRPVWEALRLGDWDIALDEITIIDNFNSTAISQKIKTRIEQYLN